RVLLPFRLFDTHRHGNQVAKKMEESVPPDALLQGSDQAAMNSAARSQSALLSRTSSRIEVIRRVRVSRPVVARRLKPPLSKFSWQRLNVLQRSLPASSARRQV